MKAQADGQTAGQTAGLPQVYPTVVHMLEAAARRMPEHIALVCEDEQLTYREYAACVAGLAHELRGAGLGAGQRVALLMDNSLDAAIAMFAVQAAGAQVVPLNPAYTVSELRQILSSAQAQGVIHDEAAACVLAQTGHDFRLRLAVGAAGGGDGPAQAPRLLRWRHDLALGAASGLQGLPLTEPDSPATLQYTGGTTGTPKGVSLTHRAVSVNVSQREALLPTCFGQERVLAMTPLFHVYAVSMGLHLAAYACSTLVILPRYRPDAVLHAIARHRITLMAASPTILAGLLAYEGWEPAQLSSLRVCYSGSAALAQHTLQRWEAATGCMVCEGYGQTEAGPVLTYNPCTGLRKAGTVGIAVPATTIQIVDGQSGTQVLGVGQAGEIRAHGPQLMSGYLGMPVETASVLRDGWLYTGDIGYLDEDGYLTICGRKKEMVIVSGFNVYPREIEDVLLGHPAVAQAAVIGVPDAYRGESLLACVVASGEVAGEGAAQDLEANLQQYLQQHLVKYKWPARLVLLDDLPKTSVGKVDKKRLKAMYAA